MFPRDVAPPHQEQTECHHCRRVGRIPRLQTTSRWTLSSRSGLTHSAWGGQIAEVGIWLHVPTLAPNRNLLQDQGVRNRLQFALGQGSEFRKLGLYHTRGRN